MFVKKFVLIKKKLNLEKYINFCQIGKIKKVELFIILELL